MKIIGIEFKVPNDRDCLFFMLSNSVFFVAIYVLYQKNMLANINPKFLIVSFFIASFLAISGLTLQNHGLKSVGVILGIVFSVLFYASTILNY